jgi:hypothetical protein
MRCWLAFLKSFIAIYGCERLLRTFDIALVEAPRSYDPIWKAGRHWFPSPIAAKRSFPNALRATSLKLPRRHRRASRGGFSDSELAPSRRAFAPSSRVGQIIKPEHGAMRISTDCIA